MWRTVMSESSECVGRRRGSVSRAGESVAEPRGAERDKEVLKVAMAAQSPGQVLGNGRGIL